MAFEATRKIMTYGKQAVPVLLEHLSDERQSVCFRRVLPCTVGLACQSILEDTVLPLPDDYQGSFYRTGADGELHERPVFLHPGVFDPDGAEAWFKAREDRTLAEMQIETLQWLIEQEKSIGFQSRGDRRRFLDPLERQLSRIRKRARASAERER